MLWASYMNCFLQKSHMNNQFKTKNCPYCKAQGNFYFNPQISQITPVPSAGGTGQARITTWQFNFWWKGSQGSFTEGDCRKRVGKSRKCT